MPKWETAGPAGEWWRVKKAAWGGYTMEFWSDPSEYLLKPVQLPGQVKHWIIIGPSGMKLPNTYATRKAAIERVLTIRHNRRERKRRWLEKKQAKKRGRR